MSKNKNQNYRVLVHINQLEENIAIDELAAIIAMELYRSVVEISSNTLELSVPHGELDSTIPLLINIVKTIARSEPEITIEPYNNTNWEQEWKKYIKPIEVGRFLICPSWEVPHLSDRTIIKIDPGMAFGTGHHETTRLCLEWIDRFVNSNSNILTKISLLDVGTGSGILAIASALSGFSYVVAIDNDPEAVFVARKNALENQANRINFLIAEPHVFKNNAFDITIANIQANVLIEMAPTLIRITNKTLVMSGILREQKETVCKAFQETGAQCVESIEMGEWVLLELRMVGTTGFEPATSASRTQRSPRLSHVPTPKKHIT